MPSIINLGLIYEKGNIDNELRNIINYFLAFNGTILTTKVCQDIDGENWIEKELISNELLKSDYEELTKGYYGQVDLNIYLWSKKLNIQIRIEKFESIPGLKITFIQDELMDSDNTTVGREELEDYTKKFEELLVSIYEVSKYDYSFCDNDAEIEHSLAQILSTNQEIYSILIIPPKNNFIIKKASWGIDGLSTEM